MTTAKKATKSVAKKAPAKPDAPTDPKTVTFMDRVMKVKMPNPEQLVAWDAALTRMQKMSAEGATMETVVKAIGRLNIIIDSVLIDDDDKEWLEDGRLAGTVDVEKSHVILLDAVKMYMEDEPQPDNRAARRAKK